MADVVLPNTGMTQPTVGADENTWGDILNADLAILDGYFDTGGILTEAHGGTGSALGAGMVKLDTGTTAAATAFQWITLPAGYTKYKVVLENFVPATDGAILSLQGSTDNRATVITNNSWAGNYTNTGGGPAGASGQGVTTVALGAFAHNVSGLGSEYVLEFTQSRASSQFFVNTAATYFNSGNVLEHYVGGGFVNTTGALTDIKLKFSTGNIGVSAQDAIWTLYGYK